MRVINFINEKSIDKLKKIVIIVSVKKLKRKQKGKGEHNDNKRNQKRNG